MKRREVLKTMAAGGAALGAGSRSGASGHGPAGSIEPVSEETMSENQKPLESYMALPLQVACRAVNKARDRSEAREIMMQTLERLEGDISGSKRFIGPDCKLVVLPEYFLTSFPVGDTIEGWADKAAIEMDGPEYAKLSEISRKASIYLSGNAYEVDPDFPGLYFQTSFIIDDAGKVVLRYRRLNSMFTPTPHDLWDRYRERHGLEEIFPVARTPLGNLAVIASEEIRYPELARCLAMRGAEVFCHSSSETFGEELSPKNVAKLARAQENMAYVVSANTAGIFDGPVPPGSADGGSRVVDYHGHILSKADTGESMAASASIEIRALRRYRRRPGMQNMLARQRFELYAESYAKHSFHPPNTMLKAKPTRELFLETQKQTIKRLQEMGVIEPPGEFAE